MINKYKKFIVSAVVLILSSIVFSGCTPRDPFEKLWERQDVSQVKGEKAELIKTGYELLSNTWKHIGPEVSDPEKRYTGNNLACKNCHLQTGTKKYAAAWVGVTARYPRYRGRENKIGTIQNRINGCMERSMNGRSLPDDSPEMQAMVAYMEWLSEGVPEKTEPVEKGFVKIEIPNRAVDFEHGEKVFIARCAACHQIDGSGVKMNDGVGYTYPPLWGEDSYNHGAGMNRVLTAARFIKANMPFGSTYTNPQLTDEEAYDVAGYIDSKPRPKKADTEKDYPDLSKKPVDSPYPPWNDDFPAVQHQFGPFQPIMDARKKAQ